MTDKTCGECKFWKFAGQLAVGPRASNEGLCSFFLDEHRTDVPMWAQDLSRATISFHGRECSAWERRPKAAIKVLKKR